MDAVRPVKYAAVVLIVLAALAGPAQAQTTLELNSPVTGSLSTGQSENWTFSASEGQALSFTVESADDLDPLLIISSSTGAEIIRNDDYNYPDSRDSLLEAVTFTRTGTYTATVSALGGTSGDYTLTLLPGYAQLATSDSLDERGPWESTGAPLVFQVSDGAAILDLNGGSGRGLAFRDDDFAAEMYAEARVTAITGQPEWTVGLVTRYSSRGGYYAFSVNDSGEWRFSANTGSNETVLRDWITHPAIVPGSTAFTLGLLSSGSGFEFFYNGVLIGRVTDDQNTIESGGQIGFLVEPGTRAEFDDLLVTVPLLVNDQPVLPDRIVVTDSRSIMPHLQRRHLVPLIGEMILTVPESFATYNRGGVYEVPLAQGQTFRNFAMGTTVSWTADPGQPVGCGLLLQVTGETDYTLAYLDQTGGYGVSHRSGDQFEPGIYGEMALPSSLDAHHLLVIANEDVLTYFVDGVFGGQMQSSAVDGGIGNAVVNFEQVNTACEFRDTWVWRWE